jgi:Apg6 BARA domain
LEADTERLLAESLLYEQAMRHGEENAKGLKQIMQRATMNMVQNNYGEEIVVSEVSHGHNKSTIDLERHIEEAYLNEIELLEQACQQHREELLHLRAVQKEQALVNDEIEQQTEAMAAEQNALELEARAFDNDQEQLSRLLAECQEEIEHLSSSEIRLPATLIDLSVDVERGLRYPLINDLRLAYRPKGDVHWKEIQAAWALASNLLLVVATIFDFRSQNWKIVPLSHCAKLIYCPPIRPVTGEGAAVQNNTSKSRAIVFNVGHPKTNGSKALLTWNALLCQLIQHVVHKNTLSVQNGIADAAEIPVVPFEILPTNIGGISLTRLNENDDSGWSHVIHYMASNLLWLSNCASFHILQQVLLRAPLSDFTPEPQDSGD